MELKAMLAGIEAATEARNPRAPGDYEQDGLLYCGKCRTPKQVRITLFGEERRPYCLCKCQKALETAREESDKMLQKMQHARELREMAFKGDDMRACTFSRDDGENARVSQIGRKYAENFAEMKRAGKGLLFFGGVGTGKSYMAACIVNALVDACRPCLMTSFARMLNVLDSAGEKRQATIDRLNDFDLLVIDDLSAERNTEYMAEFVQMVIDARYRARLPLIVTTNLSSEEIKHPADVRRKRIYSRIMEMCLPVEFTGGDRRRAKLRDDYNAFSELLGMGGQA